MKITVVPAQITTVEDRVAANLSISQLMLLSAPMFIGALFYSILPPSMEFSLYKLIVISILTISCLALAIRIGGRIVLLWLILILRYNLRPKYYVLDKRSVFARDEKADARSLSKKGSIKKTTNTKLVKLPRIGSRESTLIYTSLNNPISRLNFKTNKKGTLNVCIAEIQD